MITLDDVQAAARVTAPYIKRTPLVASKTLSDRLGTNVYLKLELFQKTGSFKPRGAFNQMLQLDPEACERGVVAVSGGNFAQAVAYAGSVLGLKTVICMPEYTPKNYIEATQGYGGTIDIAPDLASAFKSVDAYRDQGMAVLQPYDHPNQMAGNGSLALELIEDVPQVTDVFISIGGGGLITGNTVALKALKPDVRIWGVETEGSPTMNEALKAGKVVQITPKSLAKTLGAPYVSAYALEVMQQQLEELILVSDQEAIDAQRFLLERAKVLPELAASCTLAAARKIKDRFGPDDHVVLVLCGGNESLENMMNYPKA